MALDRTDGLWVCGLRYRAGAFELAVDEFHLRRAGAAAIVGHTGSGKTSFLEIVAGLRAAEAAALDFDGSPIGALPPEARNFGFAYQDSLLFPHLRVSENILFARPRPGAADVERCRALMAAFGIEGLAGRYPRHLSGGERQRVALARALVPGPRLLLLDEPFSALDAATRRRVRGCVADWCRRDGTAILLVSHDEGDIAELAEATYRFELGRCARIDAPAIASSRPMAAAPPN